MIRSVTVGSVAGLHARAAALVAAAAADLPVRVSVAVAGRPPVPADSVLALLTLGAAAGVELTLEADGVGAESALGQLCALLASDLDVPAAPDRGLHTGSSDLGGTASPGHGPADLGASCG